MSRTAQHIASDAAPHGDDDAMPSGPVTGETDRVVVPAANSMHVLEITIPMIDPESGETRTALLAINKRLLWGTPHGQVVRSIVVTWKSA